MLRLGVDHGNYAIKTSDGVSYSSGYSMSMQPPISDTEHCLEYNGRYYIIGGSRPPVRLDKTTDEDTLILTLPALAIAEDMRGQNNETFILGVGLPLMAYDSQKTKFRNYLMGRGDIEYTWADVKHCVRISNVKVYPQGYAGYLTQYAVLQPYPDITHIDIGGYTIDLFKTHVGRLVEGSATSMTGGTIILARKIDQELRRYDISLSDDQIMDAIAGKPVQHLKVDVIANAVEDISRAYARDITNRLREYGIDTNAPINLIGGGCTLLRPRLPDMYVVGHADQYANARGYNLWLSKS